MKWIAYVAVCVLLVQTVYAQFDVNSWVSSAAQGWSNGANSATQGWSSAANSATQGWSSAANSATQGWSSAANSATQDWSSAVNGYSQSGSSALPTSSAPVTVSVYDPNLSYSKAIGTLLTYGASAQSLSQYVASKYASDPSGASSFLSSVSASAQKSNTANQFDSQGSSTGTANAADPSGSNGGMVHVPAGPLTVLCTCLVALLGAGVVFL